MVRSSSAGALLWARVAGAVVNKCKFTAETVAIAPKKIVATNFPEDSFPEDSFPENNFKFICVRLEIID
jgi:hypothetical protein